MGAPEYETQMLELEELLKVKELQMDFPKKLTNGKAIHQGHKVGQRTKLWRNSVMEAVRPANRRR